MKPNVEIKDVAIQFQIPIIPYLSKSALDDLGGKLSLCSVLTFDTELVGLIKKDIALSENGNIPTKDLASIEAIANNVTGVMFAPSGVCTFANDMANILGEITIFGSFELKEKYNDILTAIMKTILDKLERLVFNFHSTSSVHQGQKELIGRANQELQEFLRGESPISSICLGLESTLLGTELPD